MHAYTHTYVRTYTHTYIHACIHTHIRTYIHTYIQCNVGEWVKVVTNSLVKMATSPKDNDIRQVIIHKDYE